MNCKLISITDDAESITCWIARVSNPESQERGECIDKLINYCIKNGHWSVFEHAHLSIEIVTSRFVTAQIIRHRSFKFQEFSQRYATVDNIHNALDVPDLRMQDNKNRQSSIEMTTDEHKEIKEMFQKRIKDLYINVNNLYTEMTMYGIAKETARGILPLSVKSKIIMTGDIRSWIHYIQTRTHESTQKEHRDVALECKNIFIEHLPIIAKALKWL